MTLTRWFLLVAAVVPLVGCGEKAPAEGPAKEEAAAPEAPAGPPTLESVLGPEEDGGHPVVAATRQVFDFEKLSVSFDAPTGWARSEGFEDAYHAKSPVDGHPMTTFWVQADPERPEDTLQAFTDQLKTLGVKHEILFDQPLPEDGRRFLVKIELPDGGASVNYVVSLEPYGLKSAFLCTVIHKGSHREAGFRALTRMCDTLKLEGFAATP